MSATVVQDNVRRGGIPRGIATEGLAVLSYGFRPFFLGAGIFAVVAMVLWICALVFGWPIGGTVYGPILWHGHEMLFGYAVAALAGFMLTTIPNWTGRLPVSGRPLLGLVILWVLGRVAMAVPDIPGPMVAAIIDGSFLVALALIAAREIVAGRNWKNLKIVAALCLLEAVNVAFHVTASTGGDSGPLFRATIAIFIALIGLVGGRIVPSFTRNWLTRHRAVSLPPPFGWFDAAAMVLLGIALASWTIAPLSYVTMALAALASTAQLFRLLRWRGTAAIGEPMVAILHVGYGFVPVGLAAAAFAAAGSMSELSVLHLFTVGAIGTMTLAVMTRATLGHTGRPIEASGATLVIFAAVLVAAAARLVAEVLPDQYLAMLVTSGIAWCLAFLLFSFEYGRMLLLPRVRSANAEA